MAKFKDLTGQVFSRLTALYPASKDKQGRYHWNCICTCGSEILAVGSELARGRTKSCGCLAKDAATTHGMRQHNAYKVWCQMKQRCGNKAHKRYCDYGGRGIKYETSWEVFENFWTDMQDGYSNGLTLDRIDNSKGYSKENCRWTTWSVQNRNKRKRLGCKREYIGVTMQKNGTFRASWTLDGNNQHLGTYKTAIEAATAYDNAVEPLIGNRPNGTTKENK